MSRQRQTFREFIAEEMHVSRCGLGQAFIGTMGYFVAGYAVVGIVFLSMLAIPDMPDKESAAPLYWMVGYVTITAYLMIAWAWLGLFLGWNAGALIVLCMGYVVAALIKRRDAFTSSFNAWEEPSPLDPFVFWPKQKKRA